VLPSLRQLFDASYLYAQNARPLGTWSMGLIALGVMLLASLGAAWVWQAYVLSKRQASLAPTISIAACATSLVCLLGRVYAVGPFSARVWNVAAITAALLAPLMHRMLHWPWPGHIHLLGRALACALRPDDAPLPRGWACAWGMVHVGSLYTLATHDGLGWLPTVIAIACLLVASLASLRTQGRPYLSLRVEVLTPLVLPYVASFLRWLVNEPLGSDVALYHAFPFADPWSFWFDLRTMLFAGLAWMLLATGALCWSHVRSRANGSAWLGVGLLTASAIWFLSAAATHLSYGVTGSDPYCYLQMAADLAERGTPLHYFSLTDLACPVGGPPWPLAPVGYHPPAIDGAAATVWPIGWPSLLAPFYRLGGESIALWIAPCCAIASALAIWALAREVWPSSKWESWLVGGLAAAITLTSREAALRTFVPMADSAAQLGAVIMLWCLARARRRDALGWSALAGVAFALAYWVRHPLLFLAPAAAILFQGVRPWKRRASHLVVFAGTALFTALPDLFYHRAAFGSIWVAESPERHLLAWRHIGFTFQVLLNDGWLRRGEFGYLWPFVAYGLWRQWRDATTRSWALALTASFCSTLLFHLSYSALRWRDLIALFPWLGMWAAQGIIALWQRADSYLHEADRLRRRALVILVVVASLAARGEATLYLPWERDVWVFGHVSQQERAEFDRLAAILPANATIGAGLNSGALLRYTNRSTFRPAHWSDEEISLFITTLSDQGSAIYLLDDGQEMAQTLFRLHSLYSIQLVSEFALPAFGLGGEKLDQMTPLYLLVFPQ